MRVDLSFNRENGKFGYGGGLIGTKTTQPGSKAKESALWVPWDPTLSWLCNATIMSGVTWMNGYRGSGTNPTCSTDIGSLPKSIWWMGWSLLMRVLQATWNLDHGRFSRWMGQSSSVFHRTWPLKWILMPYRTCSRLLHEKKHHMPNFDALDQLAIQPSLYACQLQCFTLNHLGTWRCQWVY